MSTQRVVLRQVVDVTPAADALAETAIDAERAIGIRAAMGFLLIGDRGRAQFELTRSVLRQWRIASGGTTPVEPTRPQRRRLSPAEVDADCLTPEDFTTWVGRGLEGSGTA